MSDQLVPKIKHNHLKKTLILIVVFLVGYFVAVVRQDPLIAQGGAGFDYDQNFSKGFKKSEVNLTCPNSNPFEVAIRKNINFDSFWQVWATLKKDFYQQPIDDQALYYGAVKGLVSALEDPHSYYFNPEEAAEFTSDLNGEFQGIGAEIAEKKELIRVVAPLEGSPAKAAGLLAGDIILEVDGQSLFGFSVHQAVKLIRGEKGTEVILKVLHPEETEPVDIKIVRDKIDVKAISWELKSPNRVAYVKFSSFQKSSGREFAKMVKEVTTVNPSGLIIDLRGNPGGFLDIVIDIAGYWLNSGQVIVSQKIPNKADFVHKSRRTKNPFSKLPTVILVDGGSASASEILAGALSDHGLAKIVGQKTFGKGSVQTFNNRFSDKSAIKITVAEWLTPNGAQINEVGITPDIEVELTREDFDNDRDPQLDKALELFKP